MAMNGSDLDPQSTFFKPLQNRESATASPHGVLWVIGVLMRLGQKVHARLQASYLSRQPKVRNTAKLPFYERAKYKAMHSVQRYTYSPVEEKGVSW